MGPLSISLVFVYVGLLGNARSFRTVFYKPEPGLLLNSWIKSSGTSIDRFNTLDGYPDCPTGIVHMDKFEWGVTSNTKYQHYRLRAYFVSPLTGTHRLILACKKECEVDFELQPGIVETTKHKDTMSSTIGWTIRTLSNELSLMKGFRYKIDAKYFDGSSNPYFMKLGVLLPNGTEVKPLDTRYLRRSMEFYKFNGLLAEFFHPTTYPSVRTLKGFADANPTKYPNSPTTVYCRPSIYDTKNDNHPDNTGIRHTGYFKAAQNGSYDLQTKCNSFCIINITKAYNNVQRVFSETSARSVIHSIGEYVKNAYYPLDILHVDGSHQDYLRVERRSGSGSFQSDWTGFLSNLLPINTLLYIPSPILSLENSTALSAQLLIAPIVPNGDQWSASSSYEILYYKKSDPSSKVKLIISGTPPIKKTVTGLQPYTEYTFYAHFYGFIKSTIEHNIISAERTARTDEDVPGDYPPSLSASTKSSTAIQLSWMPLSSDAKRNGIITGYTVKFKIKGTSTWLFDAGTSRIRTINSLKKYTLYEFSVAASTSKGAGLYSPAVEERTAEDVPSSAPDNIIGYNTSSTSLKVQWGDVPQDHRNGIITGYKFEIRKSSGSWQSPVSITDKFYEKTGLAYWTLYDVRVLAETSIGEGAKSEILVVRTDEDKPGGPPKNVIATAMSSSSIRVQWSDIDSDLQNGIIVLYVVNYQRKDKLDDLQTANTTDKFMLLTGLAKYIEYDMSVAGVTGKGVGIFSATVAERTIGDVPTEPPTSLGGGFLSATMIYVTWDVIPIHGRNGIIGQYKILYRKKDSDSEWLSETVKASNTRIEIRSLEYYTYYAVKVAGVTDHGIGAFSSAVYIRTDAYGPTKPPTKLNGTFVNHTSVEIFWSRVPADYRHGIIIGYKLTYSDSTIKSAPWINRTVPNHNGSENAVFNITISGLKIYTPYIFKVLAYTYRGEGPFSDNITVWTDDYEPDEIPKNISKGNKTSTELSFSWVPMDEINGQANGKITGYRIRYHVVDCHADRPAGCNESKVFTLMTDDAKPRISIAGLRKYTNYSITIQAVNRKGSGNFSQPIYVMTAEDKPDAPPQTIETWPEKSDKIAVYWSSIPESLRNGIITGYRIFYKHLGVPLRKAERSPRSINPLAVYGALPGEKMKEVNSSTFQAEIENLKEYSWYQIRVGAVTSEGLGVTFSINGTCKQGAPIEAPDFQIFDNYGFHEISLKWGNISHAAARGEVLGYRISYWPIEQNDVPVFHGKISQIDILEPNRSLEIKGLVPYTTYGVIISAFTEGGIGVPSKHKKGETCRCPKVFKSSWIKLAPIVQSNTTIAGIIPKYVDDAVEECCGNCTFGQGPSSVDWMHDAFSNSAMKQKKSSLLDATLSGTHIALPVFKESEEAAESASTLYDYIKFLPSSGMVFFKRKPSKIEIGNEGASKIVDSLLSLYTVLVVMVLFMTVAGFVFWFLEKGDNTDEFPDDFFRGTGSGIWLSFITMTTAGYGDIAPKTILGRTFAIVWTLAGIVITSLIVGQIINSLSTSTITMPSSSASAGSKSEKIMASNETLMISITKLRKKTVSGNTADPEAVKSSLLSNAVTKVMIEAFEAGTMKEQLKHPDIMFDKLVSVDASYGVVLAAEARRLKSCMNRYVKENSPKIFNELAKHTVSFKSEDISEEQSIPVILSKDADITSMLVKYGGILLFLLVIVGLMYDAVRYIRGRTKVAKQPMPVEELFHQADKLINDMVENLSKQAELFDKKHTKERWRLVRMDVKDLKAIMPNLTIFHEDLREDLGQNNPYTVFQEKTNYDSDESTVDMPVDYKIS